MARFKMALLTTMCVGSLAATAPASAGSVTYTGYTVLNNQNVTLNDSSIGINNEQGGSGQITLTGTNTANGNLAAWCVDIMHTLLGSGTFGTGTTLSGSLGSTINALLTHVSPTLGGNTDASSALQVAIWQEEYGSGLTISAPTAVLNLASTYEGNIANGTWTADPTKALSVLDGGGGNQTLVTLTSQPPTVSSTTPVPEPASMAVMAAGLFGLVASRRRSRATPSAHQLGRKSGTDK